MTLRRPIAVFIALLFFGLTFNAYACLLPLYGVGGMAMDRDCSSPQEQPARQFCDSFKTLGIQASPAPSQTPDAHADFANDGGAVPLNSSVTPWRYGQGQHFLNYPPHDLFLRIKVLRI
ncbi:MAG: hypothetical protein ACREIL_10055 [Nitrospiraceae bacterium]